MGSANCLAQTNALFRKNLVIQVTSPRSTPLVTQISLPVSGIWWFLFCWKFFSSRFSLLKIQYGLLDPVNFEVLLMNAASSVLSQEAKIRFFYRVTYENPQNSRLTVLPTNLLLFSLNTDVTLSDA